MRLLPLKEQLEPVDVLYIVLMRDGADARARAQPDLVVEAWALHLSYLIGIVRAPRKDPAQNTQRLARARRRGKGAETLSLCMNCAFRHSTSTREQHAWKFLPRDLKIEKALVVLLAHVERRCDLFDQFRLADQRLKRGILPLKIDARDLTDQRLYAHVVRPFKITRHATAQIGRLSDVQNATRGIFHNINPRRFGKFFVRNGSFYHAR